MKKNKMLPTIAIIISALIVGIIIGTMLPEERYTAVVNHINMVPGISNPAAVYCNGLGYQYEIKDYPEGQKGICKLPYEIECEEWEFFTGKCGKEYTYCEKNGGTIISTNVNCSFSSECAICILPNGIKCDEWKYFKGGCP